MTQRLEAEGLAQILVIDDDAVIRNSVERALTSSGYQVRTAEDGRTGLEAAVADAPDLVLLDLRLPDIDGFEVLASIRTQVPSSPVVVITAYASIDVAVRAVRMGAEDLLAKPFKPDQLRVTVRNVLRKSLLDEQVQHLRTAVDDLFGHRVVLGDSPAARTLEHEIEVTAQGDAPVLITGESGTGKEVVARLIHTKSDRADRPYVALNCAAIPRDLIESELFGHTRGSFTGATTSHKGVFEQARGGTVLLDEIGEMALDLQPRLLRVLDTHEVQPIGAERPRKVDFRVIASTNMNLQQCVAAGTFRQDLYYRLSVVTLHLLPLRERVDDIQALCDAFLDRYTRELGKPAARFTSEAKQLLARHPWHGNIRELRNVVERAVMFSAGEDAYGAELLPSMLVGESTEPGSEPAFVSWFASRSESVEAWPSLRELDAAYIAAVVRRCDNNRAVAARVLGLHPTTLWRKLGSSSVRASEDDGEPQ